MSSRSELRTDFIEKNDLSKNVKSAGRYLD